MRLLASRCFGGVGRCRGCQCGLRRGRRGGGCRISFLGVWFWRCVEGGFGRARRGDECVKSVKVAVESGVKVAVKVRA
jgi:hypothetical protein